MSEVLQALESENRDLIIELYEAKKHLRMAEIKLAEQTENHRVESFNMSHRLQLAEEQLTTQQSTIQSFFIQCNNLQTENEFLKQQNNDLGYRFQTAVREQMETTQMTWHHEGQLAQSIELASKDRFREAFKVEPLVEPVSLHQPAEFPEVKPVPLYHPEGCTEPLHEPTGHEPKVDKISLIAQKLKLVPSDSKTHDRDLRIFVGRLKGKTDENSLKNYFGKFGEVIDVHIPRDPSGHSRSFAYVTFSHYFGDHPIKVWEHVIDDRVVQLDISRYEKNENVKSKTLFVSGIIQHLKDSDLQDFFSKYGSITGISRPKESRKQNSRWACIFFEDFSSVDKVVSEAEIRIGGFVVDCRPALNFKMPIQVKKRQRAKEKVQSPQTAPESTPDEASVDVTKLVIHNLGDIKVETIRKYFSKFGTVLDAYVPMKYGTSITKGYGYIVMPTAQVNFDLKYHSIDGLLLRVSKDFSHLSALESSTIIVSAGPETMMKVSENHLKSFFARFGTIQSVRKPKDPLTLKCSHYAFVEFTSTYAVDKAMKNMAYRINGQVVCVTKARDDPR